MTPTSIVSGRSDSGPPLVLVHGLGGGHFPMWDSPAECAQVVLDATR